MYNNFFGYTLFDLETFDNLSACRDCLLSDCFCFSNIDILSPILSKFFSVALSFSSESCLLVCKPDIPAASSRIIFLSSGLKFII